MHMSFQNDEIFVPDPRTGTPPYYVDGTGRQVEPDKQAAAFALREQMLRELCRPSTAPSA